MERCQNAFGCKRRKGKVEENVEGEENGNERRPIIGHIGKRCWYLTMAYELLFGGYCLTSDFMLKFTFLLDLTVANTNLIMH